MIYRDYVSIELQQALLNHLWQSTAVVLLVWCLTAILRNHRACVRYTLWMTASAKFLVPFSLLFSIGQLARPMAANTAHVSRMSGIVVRSVQPYTLPVSVSATGTSSGIAPSGATERILILLLCVWAAGVLVMLASWLRSWLVLYFIARRARPRGEVSGVPVLQCESVIEPGVFGIIRPRILIPGDFLTRMSEPELETIYVHELCHVRRRDNLSSALHALVHALFWFHPAAWLIRAKLLDERERACDEHVVACGKNAEVYARSILEVCRFYVEAPAEAMAGVSGGELKRRIQRIVNTLSYQKLTLGRKLALAAAGAFILSLPVAAGVMDARQVHAQSRQQPSSLGASDRAKAFEAATVRPSRATPGCFSMLPLGGSHFSVTCVSLRGLIAMAYGMSDSRIKGPSKELDRLYDINATTGDHPMQRSDVAPLLRTLLAERFHLQVHTTERVVSGFELVVAKGGPKLKKTSATNINDAQAVRAGQGSPNFIARGMVQCTAENTHEIAAVLGLPAGAPVVDRTGLQGNYDVSLHFAPEDDKDSDLPDFFAAVEEQLGLKLDPARVPTKFLVVDSMNSEPALG